MLMPMRTFGLVAHKYDLWLLGADDDVASCPAFIAEIESWWWTKWLKNEV